MRVRPLAPTSVTSTDACLAVDDLSCFYGSQQIVWNVSFQVQVGAGVALVGRNGVGKTTVLRGISNTFGVRTAGSVSLNGAEIGGNRPDKIARAGLSLVPDDRRILPLSVMDNLRLGARPGTDWRDQVDRMVGYFPLLKDRLSQRGDTMSGGEQQTVAVARALMARPKYLLLDEPAEGLAPKLVSQVIDAVLAFREESDLGIVLVDRNIDMIAQLCGEVYGMSKGELMHHASAADFAKDEQLRVKFLAPVGADTADGLLV